MQKKKAWYAPLPQLVTEAGRFDVWIAASGKLGPAFSAGLSACAWETREEDSNKVIAADDALVTENPESSAWRGYIAAVTGALEQLSKNSMVSICSHHETFLSAIAKVDDWRDAGWLKSDGTPVEDQDIWERYLLARDGTDAEPKNIQVGLRPATTSIDHQIIEALGKKAKAALLKRLRELERSRSPRRIGRRA